MAAAAPTTLAANHERHELAERLERRESEDPLTGLPNDRGLRQWLDQHLAAATEAQQRTGLIIVHAERFEKINQTHGRAVGDEVVRAMVARMRAALTPTDRVFRTGGMNFVVVRADADVVGDTSALADAIIEAVNTPYEIDNELIRAPAVAGVAVSDTRAQVAEDLLRDAEVAAYRAADLGDGAIVQFEQSLMDHLTPATAEYRLRQALERGEFHLAYQPTLDLGSGTVIGAEALLRWVDEDRGLVQADEFLPAMEETGIIVPVGNWVLAEACRQATYWSRTYPAHGAVDVVVNVSVRQLQQSDFVEELSRALADAETDPQRLVLEIAEVGLLEDRESSWAVLRECKDLGVKLSLDGFGAGLSSISTLRRLRLDQVKIDRSVTASLVATNDDAAMVRHLCALCADLGIVTVAEGVENRHQVDLLRTLGCRAVQGYAVGEPVSPGHIDERLYEDLRRGPAGHSPTPTATPPAAPATTQAPAQPAPPTPAVSPTPTVSPNPAGRTPAIADPTAAGPTPAGAATAGAATAGRSTHRRTRPGASAGSRCGHHVGRPRDPDRSAGPGRARRRPRRAERGRRPPVPTPTGHAAVGTAARRIRTGRNPSGSAPTGRQEAGSSLPVEENRVSSPWPHAGRHPVRRCVRRGWRVRDRDRCLVPARRDGR